MRAILFGMRDRRIHHTVVGADVYILVNHYLLAFFNFADVFLTSRSVLSYAHYLANASII